MEKSALFDLALEKLMGDMDEMEGSSAMKHSPDECPDPLTCGEHDEEHGDSLSSGADHGLDGKEPAAVKIEVSKMGLPSLDGASEEEGGKAEDGLSAEEAEELRKLLK